MGARRAQKLGLSGKISHAHMRGTMTQDQDNIRTVFQTTIAFLDANNSVWSGRAPFADAVTRAKNGVDAIDTAADAHHGDSRRFVVRADEKLNAFVELGRAITSRY